MKKNDERHPDDIEMEREAKEYAANAIGAWAEKNKDRLAATISTYADGAAEDLWNLLREDFWARLNGKHLP